MENIDTTDTARKGTKYDRDQISLDLDAGMTVADIAEKHGCSRSLVQNVRKQQAHGGKPPARNVGRAEVMRKKATQFKSDFDLLAKWEKNDTDDQPVAKLIGKLEEIAEGLVEVAELYDALPPEVMAAPKRASTRVPLEVGMIVRVREKSISKWKGVTSDPDHLKVTGTRDTHVLVEDTDGARALIPRKDLEVRQDG